MHLKQGVCVCVFVEFGTPSINCLLLMLAHKPTRTHSLFIEVHTCSFLVVLVTLLGNLYWMRLLEWVGVCVCVCDCTTI